MFVLILKLICWLAVRLSNTWKSKLIFVNSILFLGTDIELQLSSVENDLTRDRAEDIFYLEGKNLKLRRPLDRDENDLSSIIFQVLSKPGVQ